MGNRPFMESDANRPNRNACRTGHETRGDSAKRTLNSYGFVNTRGPVEGHCNICGTFGVLTEDHVPPKGTLTVPQVDLFHILELLSVERPIGKKKYRHLQSGVNFRSLCVSCNSGLLGSRYDPALIHFANSVALFLKSKIRLTNTAKVQIHPGLVARSVLGHLFAVGLERTERTPLLRAAADFILDENLPLPDGIDVHYWVYPYRRQVALRDASMLTDFFKSPPIVFWCLKFFPLGFMVTWANEHPRRLALASLRDYMLNGGVHHSDIPLYLDRVPHQLWPEVPSNEGALLYGDAAVGTIPHAKG